MSARLRTTDKVAGFALVDLLVAIAVAGLAGSVLIGLVRFVEYNRAETVRRERENEGMLVLERVLRLLVDRAPPAIPGPSLKSSVSGDEHEMLVTSNGLPAMGLSQMSDFHLRREFEDAGSHAILSWVDETGRAHRKVLAQGVSEMTFRYLPLAPDQPNDRNSWKKTWRPQWRADDGPLSALQLALKFERDSISRVFVIPVEADLPAICLRNPQQAGCAAKGME